MIDQSKINDWLRDSYSSMIEYISVQMEIDQILDWIIDWLIAWLFHW